MKGEGNFIDCNLLFYWDRIDINGIKGDIIFFDFRFFGFSSIFNCIEYDLLFYWYLIDIIGIRGRNRFIRF